MTITLLAFPNQYNLNILQHMVERFGQRAATMAHVDYYAMRETNQYVWTNDKTSGFGALDTWGDGESVPIDAPLNMGTYSMTQVRYGRGFKEGPMIRKFGRADVLLGWADALIDSAISTLRTKHASVFNNAFSTSYAYREAGVSLVSASHTTAGGTRTNILGATALTFTSYDSLRQVAGSHVDYRGKLSPLNMDQLIVPDELATTGAQIVGSPQQPFTTDNQINPFVGKGLIVEPYLTSATAYFGRDSMSTNLLSLTSQKFEVRGYYEDATESNVVYGTMIFAYGVDDWPGIVGCAGA